MKVVIVIASLISIASMPLHGIVYRTARIFQRKLSTATQHRSWCRRTMPYAGISTLGTLCTYMALKKRKRIQETRVQEPVLEQRASENNFTVPNDLKWVYQTFQQHKANGWDEDLN